MSTNRDVFSHVAEHYDIYRPSAPAVLPGLLTQMAQVAIPSLVVDLGSGTGLSTFIWAERAKAVLGIELNESRNVRTTPVISTDASRVMVRVIRTDEELMIARSVLRSCPTVNAN